ncbi:hypothetical protein F5050DRAFT_1761767 [Lentinula boryana]|uniref:Protein kinase domain-containing protein n=1 Tax=Lentinula boryana TaxID=40481 RepID=A0ABQ8QC89_9AGAR|nr:hypothetical protein F5050DRAFT_1761767 [Lentinula boryana]
MTAFYPITISRHDKDKYFKGGDFTRYLGKDLAVDEEKEKVGRNNIGVFAYNGRSKFNLVIKVLLHPVDDGVYGEAMTLDDMGLYVNSGFVSFKTVNSVKDPRTGKIKKVKQNSNHPAIIMKRVGGEPITETPEWKNGSKKGRNRMIAAVEPLVKAEVMDIWAKHGFIYMDLNMGNVHIFFNSQGRIIDAQLFDFGYPGVVAVKRGTRQAEIEKWFEDCWDYFWPQY